MNKITTGCCALCQIDRISNHTPIEQIEKALTILKKEKEENTEVGISHGNGQTVTFTVVSPREFILERNLIKLGYVHIHTFERRKGYNEKFQNKGNLKLYIKNL
jgi:hypothetical protein